MGLAQAYDLDRAVDDLALEVRGLPKGSVLFYALQDNRFKGQEGWRESMLKMELAGLPRVPLPGYRLLPALSVKKELRC